MRIAYFLHGRGRGHASRSAPVIARLRQRGHQCQVFAGGDALDILHGDEGLRPWAPTLPGAAMPRTLLRQYRAALTYLREEHVDLVVSDGDMPSLLAARTLGMRTLALGHDVVFSRCALPSGLDRGALWRQRVNGVGTWLAAQAVAVHFLPIQPARPNTWVARPDTRAMSAPSTTQPEEHLVAYFRDPNAAPFLDLLARRGPPLRLYGWRGEPIAGVEVRPFDQDAFAQDVATARGVVGSSGSNLIAEALLLGKPLLALHAARDAEQLLNAQLVAASGAGVRGCLDEPAQPAVDRFLDGLRAGSFRRVDTQGMPPVSDVMVDVVERGS